MYKTFEGISGAVIVKLNNDGSLTWIPVGSNTPEYFEFQAWLAEGNTPELWNPEEQ